MLSFHTALVDDSPCTGQRSRETLLLARQYGREAASNAGFVAFFKRSPQHELGKVFTTEHGVAPARFGQRLAGPPVSTHIPVAWAAPAGVMMSPRLPPVLWAKWPALPVPEPVP